MYLNEEVGVVEIMTPHSFPHEATRTSATAISLKKIFTLCSRKAWRCLLTFINRCTANAAPPISSETPWARTALKLCITQLGACNTTVTWLIEVNARICIIIENLL